jgi:hypothetical protein
LRRPARPGLKKTPVGRRRDSKPWMYCIRPLAHSMRTHHPFRAGTGTILGVDLTRYMGADYHLHPTAKISEDARQRSARGPA